MAKKTRKEISEGQAMSALVSLIIGSVFTGLSVAAVITGDAPAAAVGTCVATLALGGFVMNCVSYMATCLQPELGAG